MAFDPAAFTASQLKSQQVKTGSFNPEEFASKMGIKKKPDLNTAEGLAEYAKQLGLEREVAQVMKPEKLTLLQRLGKGLGAFNPAEAILTGQEKGLGAGVAEYPKSILRGVGSAITGVDYEKERRTFADVAEKAGIENGIAKFGIGFLGDVLLDPSTYFGGALAKGVTKAVGKSGGVITKAIEKVSPETAAGLAKATEGVSDALGSLFKLGYKAQVGAREAVLTAKSLINNKLMTKASKQLNNLGVGILTDEQSAQASLALLTGKRLQAGLRKEGLSGAEEALKAARDYAAKTGDKKVIDAVEAYIKEGQELGRYAGVQDPFATYFPSIKNETIEKVLSAANTSNLRVGSKGWTKQFRDLLTNEELDLKLNRAFFTREAQVIKNKETEKFLNEFVQQFGKPLNAFKNQDDALKNGYLIIKDNGKFGKELGYVPKWDAKLLADSFGKEFQTISTLAKVTGFDMVTSLFKRSVTGLFAPFHVRNFLSGVMQNFEVLGIDALNPKTIASGLAIAKRIAQGDALEFFAKDPEMLAKIKPFIDRFGADTFYTNDFLKAVEEGKEFMKSATPILSKETLKETIKTGGLGSQSALFKTGRAIGQYIEHGQKATAYLTALGQGKTVQQALNLAEKAGFDYGALTQFESQIMRRLIPFYSFTRKNLGLQSKTLMENPQRINQIIKLFQNTSELSGGEMSEEEKKLLPTFIKEALGVKLKDTPEGLKQYIASFGTPIEAFTSLFSGNPVLRGISMANPILKVPIELGIGKDSFRQKDLQDVYNATEYKLAPQIVKDLLMIKEVKKDNLKKVNGKLVKVGERTEYVADPVRLLIARSLFTSRGVSYLDQVFSNDLKGLLKVLKTTTGIKPMPLNLEASAAIEDKKKRRELEDILIRKAPDEYRVFTKGYIPKSK